MKKDKNIYLRAAKKHFRLKSLGACMAISYSSARIQEKNLFAYYFEPSKEEAKEYKMNLGYWLREGGRNDFDFETINTRQIALLLMHEIYKDL